MYKKKVLFICLDVKISIAAEYCHSPRYYNQMYEQARVCLLYTSQAGIKGSQNGNRYNPGGGSAGGDGFLPGYPGGGTWRCDS